MTWNEALAPTLEQTLNLIVSALAEFFGTTTQAIIANAPAWLAKYGWYITVKGIGEDLFFGLFIGCFLGVGVGFLFALANNFDSFPKKAIFWSVLTAIIVMLITAAIPLVTCWIAPEIVGLEAAIKLITPSAS